MRDRERRGVFFDVDYKKLMVEYYNFDLYGDDDPEDEDAVEFTPCGARARASPPSLPPAVSRS